jgi:hypothetical protein
MSETINSADADLANDFLECNYDRVAAEYKRRNSDVYKVFSESMIPSFVGIILYLLLSFFLIFLYILYRISLPYSILVVTVVGLPSFYVLYKHTAIPILNIIGKPTEFWMDRKFEFYNCFGIRRNNHEPIRSEFVRFVRNTKRMTIFLSVLLVILSILVFLLFDGRLENGVGFVFFFSVLAMVVQNINAELNFDRGISERNKRLDEELLSLALEMKKECQ